MKIPDKYSMGIFITHFCNKGCSGCGQRIQTSSYKGITDEELKRFIDIFHCDSNIARLVLTGGEPCVHPRISKIIFALLNKFMGVQIIVKTNGLSAALLYEIFCNYHSVKFHISHYPNYNDHHIEYLSQFPNVSIIQFRGFWDTGIDPDLSDEDARILSINCRALYQFRVIQDKIYPCCNAENLERTYDTGKVHVPLSENWKEEMEKVNIINACKHCPAGNKKMDLPHV